MIEITSKNNQVYKLFQKLQTKKYRDKQELYLIEGENLIQEALSEGAIIQKTVISRSCAHRLKDTAEKLNGDVFVAEDSLFKNIAQTKTSQGVIAAATIINHFCRFFMTLHSFYAFFTRFFPVFLQYLKENPSMHPRASQNIWDTFYRSHHNDGSHPHPSVHKTRRAMR